MQINENIYLQKLKEHILREIGDEPVKIVLFGSRAAGRFSPGSDVDIGFIAKKPWNYKKIIILKETVEDLNIPYRVEFVDLEEASQQFRSQALKEAIVWKDYN